jgi:hypothetical protein
MRFPTAFSISFLLLAPALARADHGKGAIGGKTISPRTLHEGDASLEMGIRYQEAEPIPMDKFVQDALAGHDVHNVDWLLEYSVALSYGVTDHLTVSAGIPFSILHDFQAGGVDSGGKFTEEEANNIVGLGDASFTAKYSLLAVPVELAVIVGIKAPTGNTGEKTNTGDLLEPDHQPGSGSWDPLIGFALARQLDERLSVGASALWRITTEGKHRFRPGEIIQVATRAEYQFAGLGAYPRWYGSFEVVGAYFGRDKQGSDINRDTGGFLMEVGPGLKTRVDPHLSLGGSVYLPVYQHEFGAQHKEALELLIGMVYDF